MVRDDNWGLPAMLEGKEPPIFATQICLKGYKMKIRDKRFGMSDEFGNDRFADAVRLPIDL